jgi:hypothetical protein
MFIISTSPSALWFHLARWISQSPTNSTDVSWFLFFHAMCRSFFYIATSSLVRHQQLWWCSCAYGYVSGHFKGGAQSRLNSRRCCLKGETEVLRGPTRSRSLSVNWNRNTIELWGWSQHDFMVPSRVSCFLVFSLFLLLHSFPFTWDSEIPTPDSNSDVVDLSRSTGTKLWSGFAKLPHFIRFPKLVSLFPLPFFVKFDNLISFVLGYCSTTHERLSMGVTTPVFIGQSHFLNIALRLNLFFSL